MRRIYLTAVLAVCALSAPAANAAHQDSACHTKACEARVSQKHARWDAKWCRRHLACSTRVMMKQRIRPYAGWLRTTGDCENGSYGGPALTSGLRAFNPSPFFGRYQFTMQSWLAVGGRGDPRDAPWYEQAYRAVLLLERSGRGNWPVCG